MDEIELTFAVFALSVINILLTVHIKILRTRVSKIEEKYDTIR